MIEKLRDAQDDMRTGYCSGGGGILASSIVWMAAAITAFQDTEPHAVLVLLVGGMFIHPIGIVICKLLGGSGAHAKGNPLISLMAANTVWLILSLPLAYAAYLHRAEWFFPAMLLVIGGRYLTFALLYGMRLFWALGASLAGAAWILAIMKAAPAQGALVGASIEGVFALAAITLHVRWKAQRSAT